MSETIMVMGYPASGKSTLAKQYIDEGHTYLNRDKAGGVILDLIPHLMKALKNGENVVIDNTFPTIESRKAFIECAKMYRMTIRCEWLTTSIEDAQFNACYRMMEREGKILSSAEMKVNKSPNFFPPVVLFKYKKEFQRPTNDEGFDTVIVNKFTRQFPLDWTGKAIFLDYDGTLRETISGKKWPSSPDDIRILPNRNIKAILESWDAQGYRLLGVSNQAGIAKDSPTEEQAIACFKRTNELLGLDIEYAYCPHRVPPISCYCRKPMPGLAVQFFHKYKLDPEKCIMVGDMTSDKTFAKRSHMEFVHVDKFFEVGATT